MDYLAPDHPDAALIAKCRRLVEMEAAYRATPEDAELVRPVGYDDLVEEVTCTRALTDAGNRAKLAVAWSFYQPDWPEGGMLDSMLHEAIEALALPLMPVDFIALCNRYAHLVAVQDRWNRGEVDPDIGEAARAESWRVLERVLGTIPKTDAERAALARVVRLAVRSIATDGEAGGIFCRLAVHLAYAVNKEAA
ncbi:hypothetical protein [Acidisphaera rubrifaciens]|nr:hypothetical protein [Acidisphaera rubrifaciens]